MQCWQLLGLRLAAVPLPARYPGLSARTAACRRGKHGSPTGSSPYVRKVVDIGIAVRQGWEVREPVAAAGWELDADDAQQDVDA